MKALKKKMKSSSGRMESSAGYHSGYCTGHAGAPGHMDVRYEPEQHE